MISHAHFAKLRLAQFWPAGEIVELDKWEFMDRIWLGEAVGFSEWLRLEDDPETLRSLAIALNEFPAHAAAEVLRTIDLPVRAGMNFEELREALGEPVSEQAWGHPTFLVLEETETFPSEPLSAACLSVNLLYAPDARGAVKKWRTARRTAPGRSTGQSLPQK